MKKRIIVVLIFWVYSLFTAMNAKIWIVDNNPTSVGDFTTLADAHSAASAGDTVFVYPSAIAYSSITVTKQLFLLGVGFDIEIHGGQASPTNTTLSGTMTFNAGSEGSLLEGFDGEFIVDINTDEITIKRNELVRMTIDGSNCLILQNEIIGFTGTGSTNILIGANFDNILIANNKVYQTYGLSASWNNAIQGTNSTVLTVVNNVLKTQNANNYALRNLSSNTLVQNNIIIQGNVTQTAVYQYNMCNSTQLPGTDGNLLNINMSTVFEDPADWVDGLHLLSGSPAIGAGFNGVDMGIYGGDALYVDGGFPGLPAIFHLESEAITTPQNGLDVLIKAKSNKE